MILLLLKASSSFSSFKNKMAKGARSRRIASRRCRTTPYPLPVTDGIQKNRPKIFKKDWEDATCSVCMECPHNAVLLLCSSHDKGCRPYMCGTSFRYSNCLDQYKKAYTKETLSGNRPQHTSLDDRTISPFAGSSIDNCEATELACPLCRGQVKGWTIVEPAREYLNAKKRNCMQDHCSYMGTYKELRKHVRSDHPSVKPREVDPTLEQKWRRLEHEREREDVISTIRSSMPGAVFFGDYVVEGSHYDFDSEDEDGFDADAMGNNNGIEVGVNRNLMSVFFFLQAFGSAGNVGPLRGAGQHEGESNQNNDNDDNIENDGNHERVRLGRSGRRRRHIEANVSGDRL